MAYRWLVVIPLLLLCLTYSRIGSSTTYSFFAAGPSTPQPTPTQTPSAPPSFTGSTAQMQADHEPGVFNATTTAAYSLDGKGVINNQLLDDAQAANLVTGLGTLPKNATELDTNGRGHLTQNATADTYYQNQTVTSYSAELNNWTSNQTYFPKDVAARVDGAIPITNPTFAQINAWAALKWGVNPIFGLGDACQEDHFDVDAPGDVNSCADTGPDIWGGCSTGQEQEADRGNNHGWSGLRTNNLAAESPAFAMDFYYMHVYAEWNHLFDDFGNVSSFVNTCTAGGGAANVCLIEAIMQTWCGSTSACPNYYQNMLAGIAAACWVNNGASCPSCGGNYYSSAFTVAPATGTSIPNL